MTDFCVIISPHAPIHRFSYPQNRGERIPDRRAGRGEDVRAQSIYRFPEPARGGGGRRIFIKKRANSGCHWLVGLRAEDQAGEKFQTSVFIAAEGEVRAEVVNSMSGSIVLRFFQGFLCVFGGVAEASVPVVVVCGIADAKWS